MTVRALETDGALLVRIERPEVRNAIDFPTVRELTDVLRTAGANTSLRGVVLSGAGGYFSSGADVRAMAAMDLVEFQRFIEALQDLTRLLRGLPFASIAALEGFALGGALELACACDFRVAARSARFSFPEVSRGLVVTCGASRIVPLLVGAATARRLLLLGDVMDAAAARASGLVDEVCEDGAAETTALALLQRVSAGSAVAVRETRALLDHASEVSLDRTLEWETAAILRCRQSEDAEEGLRAFLEKREPRFH